MSERLLRLFDYHGWDNEKLLHHLKNLPEEIYWKRINSVFPTIAETFAHIIAVDELWYSRIQGRHIPYIQTETCKTIGETITKCSDLHEEIKQFFIEIGHLEHPVVYQNTKGEPFSNKISEIIEHMVNHGTYHRGNIAAMIRQMGYEGTTTDYICYLREV